MLLPPGISKGAGTNTNNVAIVWTAPPPNQATNIAAYFLYSSADITVPVSNWALVAAFYPSNTINAVALSGGNSNEWAFLFYTPPNQQAYFALAASNFWGTSFFSVTGLPPVLVMTNNLGLLHYP